jgi:hypothetical protein
VECSARLELPGDAAALSAPAAWEAQRALLGGESRRLLEEAGPAWRGEVRGRVRRLLDRARRLEGSGLSLVAFIVGEWGLGKTYTGDLIVREAEALGLRAVRVPYDNLLDAARSAMGGGGDPLAARRALEEYLSSRGGVVVVDEVESAIRSLRGRAILVDEVANNAFFEIVKGLLNPELGAAQKLRGRVHLVLLLTREAYRLLTEMLRVQGVAGKFLRRAEIVFLRPLSKLESLRLLEAYTRALTGLEAGEVFEDPRLLEVFHLVSQGNPGVALEMLAHVLRWHVSACGGGCICRVTPLSLLRSLMDAAVMVEEGVVASPVNEALAPTVLAAASASRAALLLIASGSALLPGEYGERDLEALARARMRPTRVVVARLGSQADAAEWLSGVARRYCPRGSGECVSAVISALSWLVHPHPEGGFFAALPEKPEEAAAWLEALGWPPGRLPREPHAELQPGGPGWAPGGLALPPDRLAALYRVRGGAGLEFVADPRARERARVLLEEAEGRPEALARLVSRGLEALALHALPAGRGESGLYYEYSRSEHGETVAYHVPLRVDARGLYSPEEALEECAASLEAQASITILPVPEDYQAPSRGCPGLVVLHLPQGVQRRLAAVAAALEAAGEAVDEELLARELEFLAESLGLAESVAAAAERLYDEVVIVAPVSQGVRSAREAPGVGDYRIAAAFLADAHRYLVAAGGRGAAAPEEAAGLAVALAKLAPFGRSGAERWCGAEIPYVSAAGLKDESPGMVERAVVQGLRALVEEGMARAVQAGYRSSVDSDPIAARILRLPQGVEVDGDLIGRIFILPSSETLRAYSLARVEARLQALAQLGLAEPVEPEAGNRFRSRRLRYRIRRPPPTPRVPAARPLRELEDLVARVSSTLPGEARGVRLLGALVVYKKEGFKVVRPDDLRDALGVIRRMATVFNPAPAQADYLASLVGVYNTYLRLAVEAVREVEGVASKLEARLQGLRAAAARLLAPLHRLMASLGSGGMLGRLAERIRSDAESRLERLEGEVARAVADALIAGDGVVERPERFAESLRKELDYAECIQRGRRAKREPPHRYSPHLLMLLKAEERLEARFGEVEGYIERLAVAVERFAGALERLGARGAEALARRALDAIEAGSDPAGVLDLIAREAEEEARREEERERLLLEIERGTARARRGAGEAESAIEEAGRLAERARRAASALGVEEALRLAEEAGRLLGRARENLGAAQARLDRLEDSLESGACRRGPEECRGLLGEAERLVAEARRLAERADELAGQAWGLVARSAEEEVARARAELEGARAHLRVAASRMANIVGLAGRLEEAARLLGAARPLEDPVGAVGLAARARRLVDSVVREVILDERLRALYGVLDRLRGRPLSLGALLEEVERAGYGEGELAEALRELERMAAGLGYRLRVRAERPRRSGPGDASAEASG